MTESKTGRALPKREREICSRLKQFRECLRVPQREFAEELGITRERLASYEDGRVPLRCDLALRICRHFVLSEQWLATGKGDMRQVLDVGSEPLPSTLPLGALFSEAYRQALGARYVKLKAVQGEELRIILREGDNLNMMRHLFLYSLSQWLTWFPPTHAPALFHALLEFGHWFVVFTGKNKRLPEKGELQQFLTDDNIKRVFAFFRGE